MSDDVCICALLNVVIMFDSWSVHKSDSLYIYQFENVNTCMHVIKRGNPLLGRVISVLLDL